jgi:small GTP-binding protein
MAEYLNIVVSGEVDAGKSTLIGRFLYEMDSLVRGAMEEISDTCLRLDRDFEFAYLLDSFEEERNNRLTIDTTQVICKSGKGKNFVFIDVPGHRGLLKNMLCGSSYADIAILVVDALKSIEEQTKRHAFILKFLGIEKIILVLNKMDSVNFAQDIYERLTKEMRDFFREQDINFVPISAKEGDNIISKSRRMPWYKGISLFEVLNKITAKKSEGDLRFIIQDIYTRDGEKVAVGRIISGKIRLSERVRILPLNKESRVKRIRVFNQNRFQASVPESIGLELSDMTDVSRGQVIAGRVLPELKSEISARIFCVRPLDTSLLLRIKCATQESPARISRVIEVRDSADFGLKNRRDCLEAADVAEVVILAERPLVVEEHRFSNSLGRFVILSGLDICAVGIIG